MWQEQQYKPTYTETATDTNSPTNAISFEFTQTHDATQVITGTLNFNLLQIAKEAAVFSLEIGDDV